MFQRVSSHIRIELIKSEKIRIEKLIMNNYKNNNIKELKSYLNYLEEQLKIYPCLTKKN